MGHYRSEMLSDEQIKEEAEIERTDRLVRTLCMMPASLFTVNELRLLMKDDWPNGKDYYYTEERRAIRELAERLHVIG